MNASELGALGANLAGDHEIGAIDIEKNARSAALCEGDEPAWQHSPELADPPPPGAAR